MRYIGISSNYIASTGEVIVENAGFTIEAEDILEALKSFAETETDLLENRSDKEELKIVITIQPERKM